MAEDHQKNSPEVAHRLKVADGSDANAGVREDLAVKHEEELAALEAQQARELAMASGVQPVLDGNETAALASITGQVPVRDMSNAPPPAPLGPLPDNFDLGPADAPDESE